MINEDKLILLSGNPNVGKTSIFRLLTGIHHQIKNLTGKSISAQMGRIKNNKEYVIVDLPGIYSLLGSTDEEILVRDTILFDNTHKNIIVIDSCFLEKNLNLVFQILEMNKNVLLCLNFIDELNNKKIEINTEKLSELLDVPVIMCSAKNNIGINDLIKSFDIEKNSSYFLNYGGKIESLLNDFIPLIGLDAIYDINKRFVALKLLEGDKSIVKSIYSRYGIDILSKEVNEFLRNINFEEIRKEVAIIINNECKTVASKTIKYLNQDINENSKKIDKIITSKKWGIILSLLSFFLVFYLTIVLSNYPSRFLNIFFNFIENKLYDIFIYLKVTKYIYEPLIFGIFRIIGKIISTMLPPMAIFFTLFSLGEESGLLPRIVFNCDKIFKCCKSHGKQALTMCMGFCCNAYGVIGSKVIDSPRDKLVAILTNNFIPCSGRISLLISIISIFFIKETNNFYISLILVGFILFGIFISLFITKILATTVLKNINSHFTLELPPYRKPNIKSVIYRSFIDKTLFILIKAIKVSLPAGIIIWLFANININEISLLNHISHFLNPFAELLGLDGFILFAFILALPANEIVLVIILMGYLSSGIMITIPTNITELKEILVNNGWDTIKALNVCLFSIMNCPCLTTFLTIKKEVGVKWSILAFLISLITCTLILLLINQIFLL